MGGGGGGAGGAIPAMGGAGGGRGGGGGGGGGGGAPGGAGMVGTERRTHVSDHLAVRQEQSVSSPPPTPRLHNIISIYLRTLRARRSAPTSRALGHTPLRYESSVSMATSLHITEKEREREGVLWKVLCCRPDPGAEVKQLLRQPTMLQT